jgi:transcription antitermination factor NusG
VNAEAAINWYVLKTIPVHRLEFQVLHALHQLEYQAMVPFETRCVPIRNSQLWDQVKYPLFPRYVMVALHSHMEFPYIKAKINQAAEDRGKSPPVMGLIGPNSEPGKLKPKEVEIMRTYSVEEATEVNIHKTMQIGSEIDIFRGAWAGRKSHIEAFTRKGVKAMVEVFSSWHVVEIPMRDVRAA